MSNSKKDIIYCIDDETLFFKTFEKAVSYYVDVVLKEKIKFFGDDYMDRYADNNMVISEWKLHKDFVPFAEDLWAELVSGLEEDHLVDRKGAISKSLLEFADEPEKDRFCNFSPEDDDVFNKKFLPLFNELKKRYFSGVYKDSGVKVTVDIKALILKNRPNNTFFMEESCFLNKKNKEDNSNRTGNNICGYCKHEDGMEVPKKGTPCFICKPFKVGRSLWEPKDK